MSSVPSSDLLKADLLQFVVWHSGDRVRGNAQERCEWLPERFGEQQHAFRNAAEGAGAHSGLAGLRCQSDPVSRLQMQALKVGRVHIEPSFLLDLQEALGHRGHLARMK